jgi:hypothetical protein
MPRNKPNKLQFPTPAILVGHRGSFEIAKEAKLKAYKKLVIDAATKVLVLKGYGAHASASEVNQILPKGTRLYSDYGLWEVTHGYRSLVERMAKGGLFIEGELGQWSEGLFQGLKLSGALKTRHTRRNSRRGSLGSWKMGPLGMRSALEIILMDKLPFAGHAGITEKEVLLYGLWAGNLGASDPTGVEVLSGLLMGAIPVAYHRRSWLGVPSTAGVRGLLELWGIPVGLAGLSVAQKRKVDLVSPFWGALLSVGMPDGMREWYEGMKRPGMCPLLPWAFLRMAGGRVSDEFPRKGLPFLISRDNLLVAGFPLRQVHEKAVRELGFVRVDARLRGVWARYMATKGLEFPFIS